MKSYLLLIASCVVLLCSCQWQGLISVDTNDKPYVYQTTYVDPLSLRSHIVFSAEKDAFFSWYYSSIDNNGQTNPPYLLSNHTASNSLFSASMTGDNDASTIYLLTTLKRGVHDDIYFRESASNGASWSKPIVPRANDKEDNAERTVPSIVHLLNDRLFVFYKKNGVLTFTTRAPESTIWGKEVSVEIGLCTTLKDTISISSAAINITDKQNALIFFLICKNREQSIPVVGESINNGLSWSFSTKEYNSGDAFASTALAPEIRNGKVYGAFLEEDIDSGWPRSTVFEYSQGGKWETVASVPTQRYIIQSLQLCNIGHAWHLFHLATESTIWHLTSVLKQIPLVGHFNEASLPKLDFGPCSSIAQVVCGQDNILATGAGECGKQVLYGRRFRFKA